MRRSLLLVLPLLIAADWPQHLGPNRDGHSSEKDLLRVWPRNGPAVAWKKELGSGWAGCAVAGERLLVFHRVGDDEILECLVLGSGKELWKAADRTGYMDDFQFDDGPRAVPLIAGDRVFTLGANGDLRCRELATGKAIWARNVNRDYRVEKGFFGVATSPMLAKGKLLVNVGARGAGVVAFDPATGKEVWKASDDAVSYSSPVLGELDGEELAIFFTRAGLLTVAPERGEVRHRFPWRPRIQASVNAATPIVADGRVFLSTSYSTGAILLEARQGKLEEIWSGDNSLSCHYSTPVRVGEFLYGLDGRQEGGRAQLRCVEWKTGKVRWSRPAFGCAGLIAVDGLIIAAAESGDLVLIEPDPAEYRELGRAKLLDSPVRALPALSEGLLFVRDSKKLLAVKLRK